METSLAIPLKEQENLKELFRLLDEKGMQTEKGQVMDLVDYIDNMEAQFGKVRKELQAVRHRVKKIEQRGLRQMVLRTVGKLEAKVEAAKAELTELKDRFVDGVNQTITRFKERGILSVYRTIDFLGIQRGLLGVKRHLHQSLETADRGITSLGNIGDEMYGVRTHLGTTSPVKWKKGRYSRYRKCCMGRWGSWIIWKKRQTGPSGSWIPWEKGRRESGSRPRMGQ